MSDPKPNPLAIFSLKPLNDRAHATVNNPSNRHLVSVLADGTRGLDIGYHVRAQSRNTIASLGRNADIVVEGASISRLQCSFEVHSATGAVMLYDRSNGQTTQVSSENSIPFQMGRVRRIVIDPQLNTEFGMGGVACDLVRFR